MVNIHFHPMVRYVVGLLFAIVHNSGFASSEARTTNELTNFGEILATIRTDAWINVSITGGAENISTCINDVATVWESAAAGNKWALHMLDAESKVNSGILLGNLRNLGMYDQCVEIAAQHNPTNIQSQYCMVSLSIPPDMFSDASSLLWTNKISILGERAGSAFSFTSAMCLPSSCNEKDISLIVSESIKQQTELKISKIEVAQVTCSRPTDGRFTIGGNIITAFIVVAMSFLLCCTVCDFMNRRKGFRSYPMLKGFARFSLYSNAVSILSTKMLPDTISAVNGMRVLSMIYVIVCHRIIVAFITPSVNPQILFEWQHKWYATFLFMAPFVIDTFFIISGFLSVHNLFKSLRSGKKFNILENCINRYVRLTPSVLVLILITIFYAHRFGSGPVWVFTEDYFVSYCMENWWSNLLYIQNIVNTKHMCLPHLWYLAVEMQLFFITQITLFAFFRWPKHQRSIFGLVIVGSLIVPPVRFAINGYTNAYCKMTTEMSLSKLQDNLVKGYMSTTQRSFAYLAGAVLGYIIVNKKIQVTKLQAKIYWTIACSLILICFSATRYLYLESYKYEILFEVAYAALARPSWAFAIAWVIYACLHGYGGPLAKFLSAPVFLPLNRISYCMYLVHFMLQSFMAIGVQQSIFYSKFAILHQVWGDLTVSGALGFFLSLFVETPTRILEKTFKNFQKSSEIMSEKNPDRMIKKIK